jgi:Transposase, Mutator family
VLGRLARQVAQLVDRTALHGGRGPRPAQGLAKARIAVDDRQERGAKPAGLQVRDELPPRVARFAPAQYRKWAKRSPGVVRSLQEGGAELLTFFTFPKAQWKTLRTTNVIERLNEEFRRRVKTQGSLPTEDAALILLFSLVASGQIKLRKIDGHAAMATVISKRLRPVA